MISRPYHTAMGQLLIRQLDDAALEGLRARLRNISPEALARDTFHEAAKVTVDDKLAIVRRMQEWSKRVRNPDVPRTLGVDLIREDRDRDH